MIDPTKPKPDPRASMTPAQRESWDHLRFDVVPSVRWQSIVDCCGVCARGAEMESEELAAEAVLDFAERVTSWLAYDRHPLHCAPTSQAWREWSSSDSIMLYREWRDVQIVAAARRERSMP